MDLRIRVKNLREYNTFGISLEARVFYIRNIVNLLDYFEKYPNEEYFILGGGSNIIISPETAKKNILKIGILGKEIVHEEGNIVYAKIGAGENWDDVVKWAVDQELSGIEALSAIPGTAGSTPVQNVGAYGAEIKDVFLSLTAYDTHEKKLAIIKNKDCDFTYRQSIFKGKEKGRYIIIDILLQLSKEKPQIPQYPVVKKYFEDLGKENPTLEEIRNAITEIRWSKLPHPEDWGNCGSFFENPIVDIEVFEKIKLEYPDIPSYPMDEGKVKIPAGYLVEMAGLKGVNFGKVSTYEKNALVLVNKGDANSVDVWNAKEEIVNKVKDIFGIELKNEPEFV